MQPKDNFRLVVKRGPQPSQHYDITADTTTLGRDITNDIVINDRETSRQHLRLLRSDERVSVEDLGSTNGTFVNGKRVSGITPLQNGDVIGLGETITLAFEVHRPPQSAPPPAEAPPSEAPPPAPPPQAESPPPQEAYAPPAAPAPQAESPPPQEAYAPPAAPAPQAEAPYSDAYPQQPGYPAYAEQPPAAQPAAYAPAPPQQYAGYDYDPYAVREEGGSSTRWLVLGCFIFFVMACTCFLFIGLVLIDALNLWCDFPIITEIVTAIGYC